MLFTMNNPLVRYITHHKERSYINNKHSLDHVKENYTQSSTTAKHDVRVLEVECFTHWTDNSSW